jgi:hypothetical protein
MGNITFFLGAGASYYACPIQKEQAEMMVQLATKFWPDPAHKPDFKNPKHDNLSDQGHILLDIGYFGTKALKYGTIDTYAKKLALSDAKEELDRLKSAVNIFFTVWQSTDDKQLKDSVRFEDEEIDRRYIQLMAAILEKDKDSAYPSLKSNVRFVIWNYDLQIESVVV